MKIKSILFVFLMLVALVTASKFIINSVDVTAKTVETSKVNQSVTTPKIMKLS